MTIRGTVVLALVCALPACSDPGPRAEATFALVNITQMPEEKGANLLPAEPDVCTNPQTTCEDLTSLQLRIGAAYLAEDYQDGVGYIGESQVVFASPDCEIAAAEGGATEQPHLGKCSIDLGYESTSGDTITSQPRFIELARPTDQVLAELQPGRFGIRPGTYRFLSLDMASNAVSPPPSGTQDTVEPGSVMNIRFQSTGMDEPYELRDHSFTSVIEFPTPITIDADDEVEIEMQYNLARAIVVTPSGSVEGRCTPVQDGLIYCFDPAKLAIRPVVTINGVVAGAPPSGEIGWAVGMPGDVSIASVQRSADGGTVIGGSIGGPTDFGDGTVGPTTTLDGFVARYAPDGAFEWVRVYGSTDGQVAFRNLALDSSDGIHVAMSLAGSVDLGLGVMDAVNANDDVLLHLDPATGDTLRVDRILSADGAVQVAVDPSGDIIAAGTFTGSLTVGATTLTSAGQADLYVVRLNAATGDVIQAISQGAANSEYLGSLATSAAGVFVTGTFRNTTNVGGVTLSASDTKAHSFVAAYSATLAPAWGVRLATAGGDEILQSLAVNDAGEVAVTGKYYGSGFNFGGGTVASGGTNGNLFVVKLDPRGSHVFSRKFGVFSLVEQSAATAFDADGNVFVTGDINSGSTPTDLFGTGTVSTIERDVFIAKYGPTGTPLWARLNGDPADQYGSTVAGGEQMTFAGRFLGTTLTVDEGIALSADGASGFLVTMTP